MWGLTDSVRLTIYYVLISHGCLLEACKMSRSPPRAVSLWMWPFASRNAQAPFLDLCYTIQRVEITR